MATDRASLSDGDGGEASQRRVALVTGSGAPRVGRVIAERLGELGYSIVIHANRSGAEAEAFATSLRGRGVDALVCLGDLREEHVVESLVTAAVERFGRIDVLVNSAAIWYPTALEEVTAEQVRGYFESNAVSSFLCAQKVGLQMVQQEAGGCIINISDWALCRPYLDHAAYFPSKGAVEAMTRSLAVELGHRNPQVRVNCIAPGPVLLGDDVSSETQEALTRGLLVRRLGTPEHIAHAAEFLVANDFVTGVVLPVDGGRSIYAEDRLQMEYRTG